MYFEELAAEYCDLNVFNEETRITIIRIGRLFDIRAMCSVGACSVRDIAQFKRITLANAKTVTYNGYLRYLRIIGDYAVAQGYAESNHFRAVKTGPVPAGVSKSLSDNDLWQLFSHLDDNKQRYDPAWFWLAVIKTLYFTGMRRRQLVSLRVDDLDFELMVIKLSHQGSKTYREWSIPMHPVLADVFQDVMQKSSSVLGRSLAPEDPLFNVCWHNGRYKPCEQVAGQMRARAITDFFKRVNKNTELSVGAHKFRHTVATRLCNPAEGAPDIFAVQQILGHTMISTTRQYVSMSSGRLTKVLGEMNLPHLAQKVLTR